MAEISYRKYVYCYLWDTCWLPFNCIFTSERMASIQETFINTTIHMSNMWCFHLSFARKECNRYVISYATVKNASYIFCQKREFNRYKIREPYTQHVYYLVWHSIGINKISSYTICGICNLSTTRREGDKNETTKPMCKMCKEYPVFHQKLRLFVNIKIIW